MAVKFMRKLEVERPELANLAKELNRKDGYIMYDELKLLTKKRINEQNIEDSILIYIKLDCNSINDTTTKEQDKNGNSSSSSGSSSSSSSESD